MTTKTQVWAIRPIENENILIEQPNIFFAVFTIETDGSINYCPAQSLISPDYTGTDVDDFRKNQLKKEDKIYPVFMQGNGSAIMPPGDILIEEKAFHGSRQIKFPTAQYAPQLHFTPQYALFRILV